MVSSTGRCVSRYNIFVRDVKEYQPQRYVICTRLKLQHTTTERLLENIFHLLFV